MNSCSPYLSVVVTARNDNHGGNMLERLQAFVDGLMQQAESYSLQVELILVEWNPPKEKPRLKDALTWKHSNCHCCVRIIEVPQHLHLRHRYAEALPLFQMIAKNVGIRRARGKFVLATNIDILFSDELFSFIASGNLLADRMYRTDRYDVSENFPFGLPITEQLAFCRDNVIRINSRCESRNLVSGASHRIYRSTSPICNGRTALHTNACGDFTLMAKEHWDRLHGYPQFQMFSFHLDSLLCYMAHHGGVRELLLDYPLCTYHIEHKGGWTPETGGTLKKKLDSLAVPQISNLEFETYAIEMTTSDRALIFNDGNWGFGEETLPETVIEKQVEASKFLSIVVTARNDNHGGEMLSRIQSFVDSLSWQCRRYSLDAELIVVEWNPPEDRKRIHQEISWPDRLEPLSVRFVEVPAEIHHSLKHSDKFPLFQMIAKNIGIRRARGRFVLATNVDIIFSDELIDYLSRGILDDNSFYRIDRHDTDKRVIPIELAPGAAAEYCKRNIVRINGIDGTGERKKKRGKSRQVSPGTLHTNACGDFTLMSKRQWERLRAYPELQVWSIYLDGLLLHMAAAAGLKQVVLKDPMRIYHLEHDLGWAVDKGTTRTRPSLDYHLDYLPWCQRMLRERVPHTPNDDCWGYRDLHLPEKKISAVGDAASSWITTIADREKRLYYRDQTVNSLVELVKYVKQQKPTRVVELGTLSGLSLRSWLEADDSLKVTALDLDFDPLHKSCRLIPADLSRVSLLQQDITATNFGDLWCDDDRVIFYIDAHDVPGVRIMDHVINDALPTLPRGSRVIVDDVWFSQQQLTEQNASRYFTDTMLNEIDPLQCFTGFYASYWKGGSFFGFMEVIPLMEFVNQHRIELEFSAGGKAVSFMWGAA